MVAGATSVWSHGSQPWEPFFLSADGRPVVGFLHATALMFVAFTGYARIATLGEEVTDPRRTIPRAIVITLVVSAVLYVAVAAVGIATIGADGLSAAARTQVAPLEVAARALTTPAAAWIVAVCAITAMLGVLLNLILGLSRVLLAMGRRRDMPRLFASINRAGSPVSAVVAVGIAIGALALTGNVKATWSFSAFTVLIYYAITNLAALRLPKEKRFILPFTRGRV